MNEIIQKLGRIGIIPVIAIEDAAQAMGGRFHGRRLGSIGHIGCFSLQQGKPELKAALQKALNEIKADGTYQKIVDKWIGLDISK